MSGGDHGSQFAALGQFKPGAAWTGNAGGLTKEVRAQQRAARELALQYCPRAIQELVNLLDSEDPRVRIVAANSILDRGLGKPAQALVGGDEGDAPIQLAGILKLTKPVASE